MTVKYKIEVPNELSADFWKTLTENFNIVLTKSGNIVEFQTTAEGHTLTKQQMDEIFNLAQEGINKIISLY